MKGKISEVFESIQGEGLYVGRRQLFVRFFGCNLNCRFCDTQPKSYIECEVDDLFARIKRWKGEIDFLSFTGGEPLLQKDFLKALLILAKGHNFTNYLDTNGLIADGLKEVIEYVDIIAMDLKMPSSTGMAGFWQRHKEFLEIALSKETFLKTVICEDTEETDLQQAIKLIKETDSNAVLVLQPNSYENMRRLDEKIERFRDICSDNEITSCIIPQIHKIIGIR